MEPLGLVMSIGLLDAESLYLLRGGMTADKGSLDEYFLFM
jgi:hypothetical protein